MSRYNRQKPPTSLTYYVLEVGVIYMAYDSATSALIASAEILEALETKCQFLGYRKEDIA